MSSKIITPEKFQDYFEYFNGEKHQVSSVWTLYALLKKHNPEILSPESAWIEKWNEKPKEVVSNPLKVPYQSQIDNETGTGYRECFSSSCAMIAMYWGKIKNDDEYNRVRSRYGDSTDSQAQLAALRSLGLKANFWTNGTTDKLEEEIDAGRPAAVGWLHHGSVSAPSGGGHWTVVIGYTKDSWIHNDPYGEANMSAGGYSNHTGGKGIHYSRKNWDRRWEVDGRGSGWFLTVSKP